MSRRWIAHWTVVALLTALGGCDTLDRAQYQIPDPSGDGAYRDRVVAMVQDAAINVGMVDRTNLSKAADTLIYFEEPVKDVRTVLGARRAGEYLVIDLLCFHPGGGESQTFAFTKSALESSLRSEFRQNWRLAPPEESIPVTRESARP